MKIAIGSDHLGYDLRQAVIELLGHEGIEIEDLGTYDKTPVDYPDIAKKVAEAVSKGSCDRGILICGTGIGMQISANKVKGAYAAVCHDIYSTRRSILSNDINIMCLGAIVIGEATAKEMVHEWLGLSFVKTPSLRKIQKIKTIEATEFKEDVPHV